MDPSVPATPRLDKYTCTFTQAHNMFVCHCILSSLSSLPSLILSQKHTCAHYDPDAYSDQCVWRVALGFFPMVSNAVMKVVSLLD